MPEPIAAPSGAPDAIREYVGEDAEADAGDRIAAPLRAELARLRATHGYRRRRVQEGPRQPRGRVEGRPVLSFCSNDYLGLANHPEVVAAWQRGAAHWGVGSGAAHLINGHSRAHADLEAELAAWLGAERALLFSTGYMANLGVLAALVQPGEALYQDRLNHASLLDGALLARARLRRYPHGDAATLARRCAAHPPRLIASDGVFSMDGTRAPLPALAATARAHGSWLLIDDAHGLGVLGAEGRGSLDAQGLVPRGELLLMGTLGKALGTFGAFVAGSQTPIETLIQRARSYIYTTATPPALAEATRASLRLVRRETWRRERLRELVGRFREEAARLGLPLGDSATPIQPLLAGTAERALAWSAALEAQGLEIGAVRPPTVPEGQARLRITFSAAHRDDELHALLAALATLLERDPP